jgi:hypothetical protein
VSAAYLGRLDIGFRTLAAYEGEQFALLSRLTKERSPEFLKMPHVFEYAGIRGYGNVINDGAETVRSIDPSTLSADLIPSILEGLINWKLFRPHGENPFERLIDEALSAVSEGIRRTPDGEGVFFFFNSQADTEYNLRLGIALDLYGEQADRPGWAVLGRSVVLSVLALDDSAVPARLSLSGGGEITATPGEPLSAARICRLLFPNSYPRAVGIGAGVNGIWSWTAATALEVSQENNVLDISVSFPAGETHYMMIRGLKPFTKIQLYNIDYRTDPQFERYDSSGLSYSQEDQTLLLKMKHRDTVEHIRIFY